MNFLQKLFGKRQLASKKVEFYQYNMRSIPDTYGLCSDKECPCPETSIPKGSGYLYISQDAVDFMREQVLQEIIADGGFVIGPMPILVCEQGAKLKGIDLKIAADDAKRWGETGTVPLRPTPMSQ